ncbi:50S ribosomal protein L11 [Candidatus Burarchaeum australiense]|nr:50S ribosomal protein L11 [Candidatus Burarchaeum australiense]
MADITISALVEGGKATAGPPLGPALGPLGINVTQIIAKINEKTKEFSGLSVPVKVVVNKATKEFDVIVGTPPVSALIKKELGIQLGAKGAKPETPGTKGQEKVGDLKLEQAVKIAKGKAQGNSVARDVKAAVKEVLGTCVSMGVTCDGKDAREVIKAIDEGTVKV